MRDFSKLNCLKIKLPLVIIYWTSFVLSYFNGTTFNTYPFLYACIIYIPMTIFILLDKFQISILLILFIFCLDGISSLANGTIILAKILEAKWTHIITLAYSILVIIFVVYSAVLCVKRLKTDVGESIYKTVDNKYIFTFIVLGVGKAIFMIINFIIYIIFDSGEIMKEISTFVNSLTLFTIHMIYLLSASKKEYLLKS